MIYVIQKAQITQLNWNGDSSSTIDQTSILNLILNKNMKVCEVKKKSLQLR